MWSSTGVVQYRPRVRAISVAVPATVFRRATVSVGETTSVTVSEDEPGEGARFSRRTGVVRRPQVTPTCLPGRVDSRSRRRRTAEHMEPYGSLHRSPCPPSPPRTRTASAGRQALVSRPALSRRYAVARESLATRTMMTDRCRRTTGWSCISSWPHTCLLFLST